MITIDCGPLWCNVKCDTVDEGAFIADYTTVYGTWNAMNGSYDRVVNLCVNNKVPRGIVPILTKVANRKRTEGAEWAPEITVNDPYVVEGWFPTIVASNGGPPHLHQVEAIHAALQHRCLIIEADTGSGKTSMIAPGIAAGTNERVLWLAPTPLLLSQGAENLANNGVDHAIFKKDPPNNRVVLATFSLIYKRLASLLTWLQQFRVVIVDEVHTAAAETHRTVLEALTNAHRRIGLSGTPLERSDGMGPLNVALTGPVLYKVETSTLLAAGTISKPIIRMREFRHNDTGLMEGAVKMRWNTRYSRHVVHNEARNEHIMRMVHDAEKPCVLFAQEIDHVRILAGMASARGMSVRAVVGDTGHHQRGQLIAQMRRGYFDVLVSSKVFEVGIDIPELAGVINGGGNKAPIAVKQRLGRGKRVTADKKEFEMWDVYDRVYLALEKQSAKRCAAYRDAGHEVIIEKEEQR